jgi:hypothetical protein
MQTNLLAGALLLAACSTSTTDNPLPGATNTPHLQAMATDVACGQDIAFYGAATPDLRYGFTYDNANRIQQANGVWLESGTTETTDYTWSGNNVTHILSTSGWDGSQAEITANYNGANLVDYTYAYSSPDYSESWTYAFSNFIGAGQPAREVITNGTESYGYDLIYDSFDRLVAAVPDDGLTTTWTYDDVAREITVDTGNGAYVGVIKFDPQNRELSESYTGNYPGVVDSDETYVWNGDALDTMTYRSGSEQAPHTLEVVQTSTMLYNCAAARKQSRVPTRFARIAPHAGVH